MSYDALLTHALVVEHAAAGATDAVGQPTSDTGSQAVSGRVEELAAAWPMGPGADPLIATSRVYLPFGTVIAELDTIHRIDVTPPQDYQALFVQDAGGQGHHLEVMARRVPL